MLFKTDNKIIKAIFYGNYFYGLCTVALCIESSLQQGFKLNSPLFYLLVFSSTIIYYTKAYITDNSIDTINKRTQWYNLNRNAVKNSQLVFLCAASVLLFYSVWLNFSHLFSFNSITWLMLLIFPIVAILYYGINSKYSGGYSLRSKGSVKPFVIGFTWAGFVTIYPIIYYGFENGYSYEPTIVSTFLFLKNFLFITILCIMFDIKDYAADYNHKLITFVVKAGLRKTIFYIIIPLTILSFATFFAFVTLEHFDVFRIVLNSIPFLALLFVTYSLKKRRTTLYYLIVVDGMMLLKAVFGILAMIIYF